MGLVCWWGVGITKKSKNKFIILKSIIIIYYDKMTTPTIEPYKHITYECKQSKYPQVEKLSFPSLVLGPSGAGKGVLLQRLILNIYKDVLLEFI